MFWAIGSLGVVVFIMSIILYRLYQRVNELENAVVYLAKKVDDDGDITDFLTEFGIGFVRGFFGL